MRRVVVTGVGAFSAIGRTAAEFAQSLCLGRAGIVPIQSVSTKDLRFKNGAEITGYSHQPYFDDRRADFMDHFAQYAVIAPRAKPWPIPALSGPPRSEKPRPSSPAPA